MPSKTTTVNCPTCNTQVAWTENFPDRPFCSERCKMIDLGAWSSEEHVIPGQPSVEAMEALMETMDDENAW